MPLAITNLIIESFRGIFGLKISDLGRVNLLVGNNNAGKTSVIEAIALISDPLSYPTWWEAARRRRLAAMGELVSESLIWLFPQFIDLDMTANPGLGHRILISAQGATPVRQVDVTYKQVTLQRPAEQLTLFDDGENDIVVSEPNPSEMRIIRRTHLTVKATIIRDGELTIESRRLRFRDNEPMIWRQDPSRIGGIPIAVITPDTHRMGQLQLNHFSDIILEDKKDILLDILAKIEPKIEDLIIVSDPSEGKPRPRLYVKHRDLGLAPLSTLGDGVKRALTIAMAITSIDGGILLIDEVESAMHTSVLQRVFDWLISTCRERDIQLFVTTHSLEAVDTMLSVEEDRLNEIVGYKINSTLKPPQIERFSGELLSRLRLERGLDVR